MPLDTFRSSTPLTLGVELELQLVSLSDLDLVEASPDMLQWLSRAPFPGQVVPEITESMIEVSTQVHERHDTLVDELRRIRDKLLAAGDSLNVGVCGGGTHAFQHWSQRRIFEKPRFRELSALYGYLAQQFTIFGQHVHVGCPDGDEAMYLLHSLSRYVPHFIALSAASPFVQGQDTRFDSARLNSVFAFPLSGRAPFSLAWDDFGERFFAPMERTGIVRSMKDFYWDIRPKPEYGTIELRVCDTPLTVDHAAALAAYLQALCARLMDREEPPPEEDDYLVYTYNRFQACRFGLDGQVVLPRGHEAIVLRDDIVRSLDLVAPWADRLGSSEALSMLRERVLHEGNDAQWLRGQSENGRDPQSVVNGALRVFREGWGRGAGASGWGR